MAKQPQGKPPVGKPKAKTSSKAKTYETSKTSSKQQKPKEKPLLIRKQSLLKQDAKSKPSPKVTRVGPKTSTPKDTPRDEGEDDFIQAVADQNDPEVVRQRLESKGAILVDEAEKNEQEEEVEEVEYKNYPTVCRRCYVNFSTQTSPVCNHRFCDECFAKCQNSITYSPEGLEERIAFQCFTCTKVATGDIAKFRPGQKVSPVFEHCSKGVEKVYAFSSYAFLNPQKLAVSSDKEGHSMLVVDAGCGKILILNAQGELRQFSFLKNYRFQGGLDIVNETILLSLQNDKYSSISFYSLSGAFKFSAFLDAGAEVPHLLTNSDEEIIALDTTANNLDIINQEKRVHKQKFLSESEVLNPSAMAIHPHNDNLYIYDGNNECVSVFDHRFNFLCKFGLGGDVDENKGKMAAEESSDKTIKIIIDSDAVFLRVQKSKVVAYSIEGQYISDIVVFIPNPNAMGNSIKSMKPTIRDVSLCGPGKLAVLMVGGQNTGEIRIYSYTIPNKFKVKDILGKIRRKKSKAGHGEGSGGVKGLLGSGCKCTIL